MNQDRQPSTPFATPPDDGGHQGSYTTPADVLEMRAADRPPEGPPLNRDLDRSEATGDGVQPLWMMAWLLSV